MAAPDVLYLLDRRPSQAPVDVGGGQHGQAFASAEPGQGIGFAFARLLLSGGEDATQLLQTAQRLEPCTLRSEALDQQVQLWALRVIAARASCN